MLEESVRYAVRDQDLDGHADLVAEIAHRASRAVEPFAVEGRLPRGRQLHRVELALGALVVGVEGTLVQFRIGVCLAAGAPQSVGVAHLLFDAAAPLPGDPFKAALIRAFAMPGPDLPSQIATLLNDVAAA